MAAFVQQPQTQQQPPPLIHQPRSYHPVPSSTDLPQPHEPLPPPSVTGLPPNLRQRSNSHGQEPRRPSLQQFNSAPPHQLATLPVASHDHAAIPPSLPPIQQAQVLPSQPPPPFATHHHQQQQALAPVPVPYSQNQGHWPDSPASLAPSAAAAVAQPIPGTPTGGGAMMPAYPRRSSHDSHYSTRSHHSHHSHHSGGSGRSASRPHKHHHHHSGKAELEHRPTVGDSMAMVFDWLSGILSPKR